MRIRQGNGGWWTAEGDLNLPGRVYFRTQEVEGALRVTELYIDGQGEPIQAGALRRFPLPALEQLAAGVIDMSEVARRRLAGIGPDLSRLAAFYAAGLGKARHWVADSMRAQCGEAPQAPLPGLSKVKRPAAPEPPTEIRLSPPDGGLTDAFLRDLARAYEAAVSMRRPPATAIAEATGYERRTVESWIYKARKRGLMPPASRKGRVV